MRFGSVRGSRTRRVGAVTAIAAAAALVLAGCTPTTSPDAAGSAVAIPATALAEDTATQLQDAVTHAMDASGASGAIVAVWIPWAGAWVAGVGTTATDSDEAVTPDMHFRIGDVTRAMTCDVLYDLASAGTVALDDPVSEYVRSVPNLSGVTLESLCDGTSGLADGRKRLDGQFNGNPGRTWNPRELAATGIAERTDPGGEVRDSDAAYILLGMALEEATGESARSLIAEHVAEPAELDETELPTSAAAAPGDPALPGYRSSQADRADGCVAPADLTESSSSIGFTDSGVTSTISDLARYGQSLALDAVDGSGDPVDRFADALPLGDAEYAGGAFLAGSLVGQQGAALGYLTSVYADPGTGMTVAVVLNNSAASSGLVGSLAKELAAIASKAPAADGRDQPEVALPWTAEQQHEAVASAAVCPIG